VGAGSVAVGWGSSASADNSVALGASSAAARGAQTDYVAAYIKAPQTSVGEVSVGGESGLRQITGVAAGSELTDAVNVAQLHGAVGMLRENIADVRDIAISAGAIAMAASQLRFDDRPGKLSLAAGGAGFHGQGAFAVGMGYTSPDQFWRANFSGSFAQGEAAFGGGVSFTLN
jgi:autotransporter adhesin